MRIVPIASDIDPSLALSEADIRSVFHPTAYAAGRTYEQRGRVQNLLIAERGADEQVWGSMIKQTLKRVKPGFNEGYYGFRSFNALLEEAQAQNLVQLERDQKSGGYLVRPVAP